MGGIVGIVGAPEPVEARVVLAMRDRLAHRGPDDAGIAFSRDGHTAFGHRRLAILDPSPAGHQPMQNRGRTLLATYNGEIYNFREIGAELERAGYSFLSRSDTEVLLAAFEHWGLDAVERLHGMFAFALWSEEMRECMLVRDRVGMKPLYYAIVNGVLYFASEATALHAVPEIPKDLDPAALGDYLAYGYVPGSRSIWRGIHKLPPGHFLVFADGKPIIRRYWSPPASPDPRTPADAATLRSELEAAVHLAMVSDVPIAAFLSGGLDSSTIVALMPGGDEPVHSYTVDFAAAEPSGAEVARLVAQHCGTDHRERRVTLDLSLAALTRVIAAFDEPIADESIVPAFFISEEVARDVKVVVSGDGSHEIFAGHRRYPKLERIEGLRQRFAPLAAPLAGIARWLPRSRPTLARVAHRFDLLGGPTLENYFRQVGYFDGASRAALVAPALAPHMSDDALWLFRGYWRPELPLVRRLQFLDFNTYLADDVLPKLDRTSMRHSLETRVPLLDHRLVEHAFRLPLDAMYRAGTGKRLLREVSRDLLPEAIQAEPLPGFSAPRTPWRERGLGAFEAERLRNGFLLGHGLVRRAGVESLLTQPDIGRNSNRIWLLLVLDLWLEAHFG